MKLNSFYPGQFFRLILFVCSVFARSGEGQQFWVGEGIADSILKWPHCCGASGVESCSFLATTAGRTSVPNCVAKQ